MSTAYGTLTAPKKSEGTQGRLNNALPLRCTLKKTRLRVELDHLQDRFGSHKAWRVLAEK
jgi:hypothetical protein